MPSNSGTVMSRAASHLNDSNAIVFTPTVLLPFFNMALDELEEELATYDLTPLRRDSLIIPVAIGDKSLTTLPLDFVEAEDVLDKASGSTSDWGNTHQVIDIDVNNLTSQGITEWTTRSSQILINPPTTARSVLLKYIAGLQQATGASTALDIESSRRFLALVTARNAARDLGNSPTKANTLEPDIFRARDALIRRLQRDVQSIMGVRRQPYRGRR